MLRVYGVFINLAVFVLLREIASQGEGRFVGAIPRGMARFTTAGAFESLQHRTEKVAAIVFDCVERPLVESKIFGVEFAAIAAKGATDRLVFAVVHL